MTPTMERNATEALPEHRLRPPLVLVEFEAKEEYKPTPNRIPASSGAAIKDRLYEFGTLLWMASIVAAIAACMAHL